MIQYSESLDGLTPERLTGFFVGWPNPPSPENHLRILHGSQHRLLAIDTENSQVVGFITALSDGVSAAYIPHLEVLPQYQGQGIGTELVRRMLDKLRHLYMIDLMCDADLQPFYERMGLHPYTGMVGRNYDRQACD
jgi:ribosomal protein S18 acetylase RimI-like enzyme